MPICETNYQQYSLRYYPLWDCNNISQVIGLINMTEFIFDSNPNAKTWVEIGCLNGESSTIFLGFNKLKELYCIDSWQNIDGYGDFTIQKPLFFARMKSQIEKNRCIPIESSSVNASFKFENESIDVVYIDGDHSYEFVKSDLKHWFPKLKKNGFLCGHDYGFVWPGVAQAVNEFVSEYNLSKPIVFEDSSFLIKI